MLGSRAMTKSNANLRIGVKSNKQLKAINSRYFAAAGGATSDLYK